MAKKNDIPWLLQLERNGTSATDATNEPVDSPAFDQSSKDNNDDYGPTALPDDTLGLALSGGGIRSATFCLGILQALAVKGWLKHVDFLSTVSGGGYIGAFLGRYFDQCRNPVRVNDALMDSRSEPVHWLRVHSNYLSPKGLGDTMFNFVYFWRNFFTVHFVQFVFLLALFGISNAFTYGPWADSPGTFFGWVYGINEWLYPLSPITNGLLNGVLLATTWARLAEVAFWVAVLPLGIAYWVVSPDRHEDVILPVFLTVVVLSIAGVVAFYWVGALVILVAVVFWIVFIWKLVAVREGRGDPNSKFRTALGRNYLTDTLATWTAVVVVLVIVAAVDHAARFLAMVFLESGLSWPKFFSALGGTATLLALAPFLRWIANSIAGSNQPLTGIWRTLARIPYLSTAALIAVAGLFPLAVIAFLSHALYGLGESWWTGVGVTAGALLVSYLLGRRSLVTFVNRSSNLPLYSARLARVFLGAVNPRRHRHRDGKNISRVILGDDVSLANYEPHAGGGPLHLINVAVNETVDVASERGIRDRKAENMAIGPAGINLSRRYHAIWTGEKPNELEPTGELDAAHPFLTRSKGPVEVEGLNLRQWISISGAAFSPGMGRDTQLVRSLLFTLTNLRLGYWWDSNIETEQRFRIPPAGGVKALRRIICRWFAPQCLLLSEAIGRFAGPWNRHWYLSDGGHFELTGGYELIRRRVPYAIVVDVGADGQRHGSVLAWLIRLCRIDFGAKFECVAGDDAKAAGVPDEIVGQLGKEGDLLNTASVSERRRLALYKVTYPNDNQEITDAWNGRKHTWLLYIRADVLGGEPADVRSYQLDHPEFPNEPTTDQYFDEPQWESYRQLGQHIGEGVFQ